MKKFNIYASLGDEFPRFIKTLEFENIKDAEMQAYKEACYLYNNNYIEEDVLDVEKEKLLRYYAILKDMDFNSNSDVLNISL